MIETWDFTEPLAGALLRDFLRYSRGMAPTLCLMLQEGFEIQARGVQLLQELDPWLVSKSAVVEWPGSQLAGYAEYREIRYEFFLAEEVANIVADEAPDIYSWSHPRLPEDPHLLRPDRSTWFASTTTERWSWLEVETAERVALVDALPEIAALLRQRAEL